MITDNKNNKVNRLPKAEEMILKTINEVLLKDVQAPKNTLLTINRMKLYADLSQAIIYYTVLPDNKLGTAKRFFKEKRKSIEYFFKRRTGLQRTPNLFFRYDSDAAETRAFDQILDDAFADLPPISEEGEE